MSTVNNKNTKRISAQTIMLFLLLFSTGILNSSDFFVFMGLDLIDSVFRFLFYMLLILMWFLLISNKLIYKRSISLRSHKYWIILVLGVLIKYFILFVQNPISIFPGGGNFSELIRFGTIFALMILLIFIINNIYSLKVTIYALSLGMVFSVLIPTIILPEMIGRRITIVDGYYFIGGVWNTSVIAFISVGWLLIALSTVENNKYKRTLLSCIFILLIFGGLAGLSRAFLVAFIASTFIYLVLSKQLKKYFKVGLYIILTIVIISYLFPSVTSNFSERLDTGIDIQNESRVDIWKDYIEDLPDYFLFGEIEGNYKKYSIVGHGPHSVLLNWLSQYGIISLLGFIILIIGILISIKNIKFSFSNGTSAALYAWLIAYLSVALINETGFKQLPIFAAFGIIIGWGKIMKTKHKSSETV